MNTLQERHSLVMQSGKSNYVVILPLRNNLSIIVFLIDAIDRPCNLTLSSVVPSHLIIVGTVSNLSGQCMCLRSFSDGSERRTDCLFVVSKILILRFAAVGRLTL
jgi:hypothetical protein